MAISNVCMGRDWPVYGNTCEIKIDVFLNNGTTMIITLNVAKIPMNVSNILIMNE